MTVTFVRDHPPGTSLVSGSTVALTTTAATTVGNVLVAWVSFDNKTNATSPIAYQISKPAAETASWTYVALHNSSSASAGGGVRGDMYAIKTTVAWPVGTVVTATLNDTVTAKTIVMSEFAGVQVLPRAPTFPNTGGVDTAGHPTSTLAQPPLPGDLVLGGASFETNNPAAPDSDTAGGTWSSGNTVSVGTGVAGVTGLLQYKIVTDGSAQTYNPIGQSDSGAVAVVLVGAGAYPVKEHNQATATTSGTTLVPSTAALVPAGNALFLSVATDWTATSQPTVTTITRPGGETATWTKLAAVQTAPATTGGHLELWGIIPTISWPNATSITLTLSSAVNGRACVLTEYAGVALTVKELVSSARADGVGPSYALVGTTLAGGDLVIGTAGFKTNGGALADTDTTNGYWTPLIQAIASAGAGSDTVALQSKTATAAGAQSFDPRGNGAWTASWGLVVALAQAGGAAMGKVVVGGVKKPVVNRWVIVGGVKKPVAVASVIVGGVKKPIA